LASDRESSLLLFVCFKLDTNKAELYEEVEIPEPELPE
jgi:hypothetical protein